MKCTNVRRLSCPQREKRSRRELDPLRGNTSVVPHSAISRGHATLPNDPRRYDKLRAQYRVRWDAHQVIANQNTAMVRSGQQPSNEQLINEQRAAEAVALARAELLAAIAAR
jgi:hypothetical protein